MSFLTRSLQTCAKVPASKADVKRIVEYGMKAIDDGDNVVRTAAADLLGTLLKILGERSILAAHFEKLDSNKMTKIKEFCDSAVIKGKVNFFPHISSNISFLTRFV